MDSGKERRKYDRYNTDAKVYFRVIYDVKTKVRFQLVDKDEEKTGYRKYLAISKNISAEGICFTSFKELMKGDILYLEVYVPGSKKPVMMEGEVRWCHATNEAAEKEGKFDTSVLLTKANGKDVSHTILKDEGNKIVWSAVLESIFGNFRNIVKEQKE